MNERAGLYILQTHSTNIFWRFNGGVWTPPNPSSSGYSVVNSIGGDLVHVLGDGVGALAPKNVFFCPPPKKMRNSGGGRRGTHCYLELNVGSVLSCIKPIDAVYISIFYPLTPDLCLFLVGSGKIEINHINIEPQVQIKAKSIIQFDNQHEFRIENGFRLI